MKLTPYFDVDGTRYEIKKTRWLIAEYDRLNKENPATDEDKANALTAGNLISDVRRYAEQEKVRWGIFCKEPTEENEKAYLRFKALSDKAVADYNAFSLSNDVVEKAYNRNVDILERIAIKAIAEQYYDFNESIAKKTWDAFASKMNNNSELVEWLKAMAECLFEEDEEENNDFLSQMRRKNEERENNRKNGIRKKR